MDLDTEPENRKTENWKPEKQVFYRIFSQIFLGRSSILNPKEATIQAKIFLELSKQMWFNGCVFVF